MGNNELTSLQLWPHGLRGTLSPSENKGTLAGRGQRTRQLNSLPSMDGDTISCHLLCCTNDLMDMKGRCCLKITVSIHQHLFTPRQPRHIWGILPRTALSLWRKVFSKKEVDIISCNKWWINEELRYIYDGSINHNKSHIIGIWNISELKTFSWWLHNGDSIPRGRRSHSRKYVLRKILIGIYFHILAQY